MKKLKVMTVIGTRPEIIRLSEVIKKCDKYFDQVLVHTGQNYDYTLNQIFFEDLGLRQPDYYLDAVGENLGQTMGNIIAKSYELMEKENKPEPKFKVGKQPSIVPSSKFASLVPSEVKSGTSIPCFLYISYKLFRYSLSSP